MNDTVYTLQVTEAELELLSTGVELWEHEPTREAMFKAIVETILRGKSATGESREEIMNKAMFKANEEVRKRKLTATRLRLRILEAQERPSEFKT